MTSQTPVYTMTDIDVLQVVDDRAVSEKGGTHRFQTLADDERLTYDTQSRIASFITTFAYDSLRSLGGIESGIAGTVTQWQ